jgi:hypothetical protein
MGEIVRAIPDGGHFSVRVSADKTSFRTHKMQLFHMYDERGSKRVFVDANAHVACTMSCKFLTQGSSVGQYPDNFSVNRGLHTTPTQAHYKTSMRAGQPH